MKKQQQEEETRKGEREILPNIALPDIIEFLSKPLNT